MAARSLRITSGPAAGRSIEIEQELVIGRENADVTIEDSELSRRHAAVRPVERGVEIEDLGSLNGTFVNGERISGPVTLTAPGMLKVGVSQATVEVALPQTTRMADAPDAPAPPGATVARSIPDPQGATAEKPVAAPDVTVQRPTAKPDVTVERAQPPDATVLRSAHGPEVTVQRPVEAAGPPAGGKPPPAPPAAPRDEGTSDSGGPKVPLIAGAAVTVVALIVVAVVLASGGGEGSKTRKLSLTLDVGTATAKDKRLSEMPPGEKAIRWNLFGQARGRPFGTGNVKAVVILQPGGPPPGAAAGARPPAGTPGPATVTPRFVLRFPGGTVIATERVQSLRRGEGLRISGTGRILSGTGDFEGARGTFRVKGARPQFDESAERVEWRGSVEY